jgi:hypothetical protein
MVVMLEFINGLQLGVEHMTGDEEDEYHYAIILNVTFLRFVFMKMKENA